VIETLQVSGDDHLGGDYLTHELVWLAHQNEKHLSEMEEKEVPMMRPVTVPPNTSRNKPFLYKRSLAGAAEPRALRARAPASSTSNTARRARLAAPPTSPPRASTAARRRSARTAGTDLPLSVDARSTSSRASAAA
jgi:hypothetical protein